MPTAVDTRQVASLVRRASDGSLKYRFNAEVGLGAEAAYFFVPNRDLPHIACISTQLGCAAKCRFCSTSDNGLYRNLSADELITQATVVLNDAISRGASEELCEVSFMGMGEPLANVDNLLVAINKLHTIYPRLQRVAVSTIGPAHRIVAFGELNDLHAIPIHLQISLHATTRDVRRKLIPHAPDSIEDLIRAGVHYHQRTGDRVCLNYLLLDGINDTAADAEWFACLDRSAFIVKLTVLNDIPGMPTALKSARPEVFSYFCDRLGELDVVHKVFRGDGLDVLASCGQLAATPVAVYFRRTA